MNIARWIISIYRRIKRFGKRGNVVYQDFPVAAMFSKDFFSGWLKSRGWSVKGCPYHRQLHVLYNINLNSFRSIFSVFQQCLHKAYFSGLLKHVCAYVTERNNSLCKPKQLLLFFFSKHTKIFALVLYRSTQY